MPNNDPEIERRFVDTVQGLLPRRSSLGLPSPNVVPPFVLQVSPAAAQPLVSL